MKRHHKKEIVFKNKTPLEYIYKCNHLKHTIFYYFKTQPMNFSKVVLIRLESIALPNLDVYEVRANSCDGMVIGHALDCHGKNTVYRYNFVGSSNYDFANYKLNELNENNLTLRFVLGKIMLFEYSGMASLAAIGLGDKTKEAMELN